MCLTISEPAFITNMLSFLRFITSSCYSTKSNCRTMKFINFFININLSVLNNNNKHLLNKYQKIPYNIKKIASRVNLIAQVGSNFQSPDCHLVNTVNPYSHSLAGQPWRISLLSQDSRLIWCAAWDSNPEPPP